MNIVYVPFSRRRNRENVVMQQDAGNMAQDLLPKERNFEIRGVAQVEAQVIELTGELNVDMPNTPKGEAANFLPWHVLKVK